VVRIFSPLLSYPACLLYEQSGAFYASFEGRKIQERKFSLLFKRPNNPCLSNLARRG
jgi:hypothetical protein